MLPPFVAMPGLAAPARPSVAVRIAFLIATYFQLTSAETAGLLQFGDDAARLGIGRHLHAGKAQHRSLGVASLHQLKPRFAGTGAQHLSQLQHGDGGRKITDKQFHIDQDSTVLDGACI